MEQFRTPFLPLPAVLNTFEVARRWKEAGSFDLFHLSSPLRAVSQQRRFYKSIDFNVQLPSTDANLLSAEREKDRQSRVVGFSGWTPGGGR